MGENKKQKWIQPTYHVEKFQANEYISACGTGVCNVSDHGTQTKALTDYEYVMINGGADVSSDRCRQSIEITGVDSTFFGAPNAHAIEVGKYTGWYYGDIPNRLAWSYNGHLFSSVTRNTTRPNHS